MTPSGHIYDEAGVLTRRIKPHSREKASDTFRYADTVSVAVGGKRPIWWLELFAGPGRLYDVEEEEYLPGSPLQALNVRRPFSGYSFADLDPACTSALLQRIGDRDDTYVLTGDANDIGHLARLTQPIPRNALLLAYLDPEGLDLHFDTIRFLAARFPKVDLLLNLPVQAIQRVLAKYPSSPKAAALLEHDAPAQLLCGDAPPHTAIRSHFAAKLAGLGFLPPVGSAIRSQGKKVPQYDLLVASRDPLATKLWLRATQDRPSGQRRLELSV